MCEFDQFALSYNNHLNKSLKVSGEDYTYFARQRIQKLDLHLKNVGIENLESLMDFGCGTGNLYQFAKEKFSNFKYLGVDPSLESIKVARSKYSSFLFKTIEDYQPDGAFTCAYSNGVFHHIEPLKRIKALRFIYSSLRDGGVFSFWENNSYNIGTRYIMSKNPFDKNAKLVPYTQAKRLLESVGFKIQSINFYFYFPAKLKILRFIEPLLKNIPLGAQYQIFASK